MHDSDRKTNRGLRTLRGGCVALASAVLALVGGIAGAQAPKCKLVRAAEWPVRIERNLIIVDGAINGKPVGIMLDTGAARTLVFRSAAARIGLAGLESNTYRMMGVGGEARTATAMVNEFRVGDFVLKSARMLIAGDAAAGVDVILGEDVLQNVDVEFDLAHGAVRLFQAENCGDMALAYWATERLGEVEMDALHQSAPKILVNVRINGHPLSALLDSGASLSILDKAEAARAGVTTSSPGVFPTSRVSGMGSKRVASWIGPFQSFSIGNETIRDTEIRFADIFKDATYTSLGSHIPTKMDFDAQMLLGVDFLLSHRVLVAHSQRRVYFTFNGGRVFALDRTPMGPPDPRQEYDEQGNDEN